MEFSDGCMICLDDYSYSKIPKILPCSHTICSICLVQLSGECRECPYCRSPFTTYEIFPNNDFIKKIVENDMENLAVARRIFEERLSEIIQNEINKHEQTLRVILEIKESLIQEVENIKIKIDAIIGELLAKRFQILDDMENEINLLESRMKMGKDFIAIDVIQASSDRLRQKYVNENAKIEINSCETTQYTQKLHLVLNKLQEPMRIASIPCEIPLFSCQSTLGNPLFWPRHRDRFSSRNLFDPLPGFVDIYNVEAQTVRPVHHEYITQDSTCFQLHPNTVCILNSSYLLYIDQDKDFVFKVPQKKNIIGYCLGRFNGDLVIIGGDELGESTHNRRKAYLRKNRKEWVSLRTLRVQRMYATAESIFNKIYVIGGNPDMSIEYFNGEYWNMLPVKLQHNWKNVSSCYDRNLIYLLGGEGEGEETSSLISVLNLETNSIREIEHMNEKVVKGFSSYCVYLDGKIYYNFGDKLYVYTLTK